jgi:Ran GTPase-activating protein (RanGAP) involved in mRNA processing and transport
MLRLASNTDISYVYDNIGVLGALLVAYCQLQCPKLLSSFPFVVNTVWIFTADDVMTPIAKSTETVYVESSSSWTPQDYYLVGIGIARYQLQWKLTCEGASMGDEKLKELTRGMSTGDTDAWAGSIECDFSSNDISLKGIKSFMKIPPQLAQQINQLNLADNRLNKDALNAFSTLIPKLTGLQELSLGDNPIGNGGAVKVLKYLHRYKTPLKKLSVEVDEENRAQLALLVANSDLEDLYITGKSLSPNSAATVIMKGLLPNSSIQVLFMDGSLLSNKSCVSFASLLQQAEYKLSVLHIRESNISGEGAAHLAAALTNNHSLTELDISVNPIGETGAIAFGNLVSINRALTTLSMDRCRINHAGCVQLAEGLTENTTLQTLWMQDNRIGVDGARALSEMITKNKTLRELYLCGDTSLGEGVDSLLASVQNNTTLEGLILPEKYHGQRPADDRVSWN